MIHQSTRRRVCDKLLESLGSAEAGGRELDIIISYVLGEAPGEAASETDQMIQLLVEEGYSWQVVSELLDAEVPAYTGSLDAALPGENIVLVLHSAKRGRWAAVHKTPAGERVLVWAASECLARRRAALTALRAALALAPTAKPAGQAAPRAPEKPPRAAGPHGWSRPAEARAEQTEAPAEEESETEWKILF